MRTVRKRRVSLSSITTSACAIQQRLARDRSDILQRAAADPCLDEKPGRRRRRRVLQPGHQVQAAHRRVDHALRSGPGAPSTPTAPEPRPPPASPPAARPRSMSDSWSSVTGSRTSNTSERQTTASGDPGLTKSPKSACLVLTETRVGRPHPGQFEIVPRLVQSGLGRADPGLRTGQLREPLDEVVRLFVRCQSTPNRASPGPPVPAR